GCCLCLSCRLPSVGFIFQGLCVPLDVHSRDCSSPGYWFPASWVIPLARSSSGLHPGGYVLSPKVQYPLRDMDEQFASGWHRTRKHDNWSPRL
ncbi:unnamed protein product, partial [Brassica oleracea var. botrytis]